MSQLREGQRVRVTFEGTIYAVVSEDAVYVKADDVKADDVGGYQYASVEHVTLLDPPHWPPRVGDIWEAGGHEYIIRDPAAVSVNSHASTRLRTNATLNDPYLVVSPLDAEAPTLRGRFDDLKAANPTLIRRRGGFHR